MTAGAINFLALVGMGAALLALALSCGENRNRLALGALAVGVVAGVALTVSGFVLMYDWPARMERFDFSGFEPTMDVARPGTSWGPYSAIYFWPYWTVALGAFATYAFGWRLYRRLWAPES